MPQPANNNDTMEVPRGAFVSGRGSGQRLQPLGEGRVPNVPRGGVREEGRREEEEEVARPIQPNQRLRLLNELLANQNDPVVMQLLQRLQQRRVGLVNPADNRDLPSLADAIRVPTLSDVNQSSDEDAAQLRRAGNVERNVPTISSLVTTTITLHRDQALSTSESSGAETTGSELPVGMVPSPGVLQRVREERVERTTAQVPLIPLRVKRERKVGWGGVGWGGGREGVGWGKRGCEGRGCDG